MKQTELVLEEKDGFVAKEAFNALRTNIFFSGKDIKTVVFTSCEAHEGKTTIVLECCRNMAEVGKHVLLIDCDMRKSPLLSYFSDGETVVGLSQILTGQAEIADAIYRSQIPGFDVIFSGVFPPDPTRLIDSPAFKELLDQLRDRYDYILVDTPPLGLVIDAALAATACDGAVFVIDRGRNNYRVVQKVKAQMEKTGCQILGAILNDTGVRKNVHARKRAGYYYYDDVKDKKVKKVLKNKSGVAHDKAVMASAGGTERSFHSEASDPLDDVLKQIGLKKNPNAGRKF